MLVRNAEILQEQIQKQKLRIVVKKAKRDNSINNAKQGKVDLISAEFAYNKHTLIQVLQERERKKKKSCAK